MKPSKMRSHHDQSPFLRYNGPAPAFRKSATRQLGNAPGRAEIEQTKRDWKQKIVLPVEQALAGIGNADEYGSPATMARAHTNIMFESGDTGGVLRNGGPANLSNAGWIASDARTQREIHHDLSSVLRDASINS